MTPKEKWEGLHKEADNIFQKAKAENRELTAEELKKSDELFTQMDSIQATATAEKRHAKQHFTGSVDPTNPNTAPSTNNAGKEAKEIYRNYLLYGIRDEKLNFYNAPKGEKFAITTSTGSGAILPKEVELPLIVRRPWNGWLQALGLRGRDPIMTDGTESISIPVIDDTLNQGSVIPESGATTGDVDPNVPPVVLGQTLYQSFRTWISNTALSAPGYDLETYVMEILQKRIDLTIDASWTAKSLTILAANPTRVYQTVTGEVAALTYNDILNWFYTLAYQFRADGVFLMSDGLKHLIHGLKDNNGRPLLDLVRSLDQGEIPMLFGCPVATSPSLVAPAAGAVCGLFVSAQSILCRLVKNARIARYVNIPIDAYADQTGFQQFQNGDMNLAPGYAFFQFANS